MRLNSEYLRLLAGLFLPAIAVLLCRCDSALPEPRPELVVEGWIDTDGFPQVMLTLTAVPSDDGMNIADNLVRWGKVTVSDGDTAIVLTGGYDKRHFPPFLYKTYDMVGAPGRTYTVTAEYGGMTARASASMPQPTPVDALEFCPVVGDDSLRSAYLHFTAPDDTPAYYRVLTRVYGVHSRTLPGMLGTFSATTPGEAMRVPVYRPHVDTDTVDFMPHFRIGELVEVKLCRVDRNVYEFWKTYDNEVTFGGSQFVASKHDLCTNIVGGYGVWSVQGSSRGMSIVR